MKILSLREQQLACTEILDYVDKICRENNIIYSLDFGTLIGAVRHQGFIPWDDDIDISMTRDQYEKFVSVWGSMDHTRYQIGKWDDFNAICAGSHSYIYDKKIITVDRDNNQGNIFLDIFIYDGIPNNKIIFHMMNIKYKLLNKLYRKTKYFIKKPISSDFILMFLKPINSFLFKRVCSHIKFMQKLFPLEKADHIDLICESDIWERSYLSKSYFSYIVDLDFEGRKFPCMNGYHEHLTRYYGDYLTPPPKEEQIPQHTSRCYILDEFKA